MNAIKLLAEIHDSLESVAHDAQKREALRKKIRDVLQNSTKARKPSSKRT